MRSFIKLVKVGTDATPNRNASADGRTPFLVRPYDIAHVRFVDGGDYYFQGARSFVVFRDGSGTPSMYVTQTPEEIEEASES